MNRQETGCVCAQSYTLSDDETECVKIIGTCSGLGPCKNCPINSFPNEKRTTCECFKYAYFDEKINECTCYLSFTINDAGNACAPVLGSCLYDNSGSQCYDCPLNSHPNKKNTTCECNNGFVQLDDYSCGCKEGFTFNDDRDACLEVIGTCPGDEPCTCPPKAMSNWSYTTCKCIDNASLNQDKTACECDEGYIFWEEIYYCVEASQFPTGERSQTINVMRANLE